MESPYAIAPLTLDSSAPQFRLLELHPRTSTSKITCTLSSYSLNNRQPPYKALSYTWGPKAKTCPILLNGVESYVGRSLWTFLEQMCLQGQHGFYWVDAICIDQDNVLEKNYQVKMMRRIYSAAEEVMIWLGEADHTNSSDTAMDILAGPNSWLQTEIHMFPGHFYSSNRMAVRSILTRDYWSRIWIVQETMVAEKISVYCGSKRLEWQALADFMTCLAITAGTHWSHVEHFYDTLALRLIYDKELTRFTQKKTNLVELLLWYKNFEASNVLDKVFALCGLARDADNIVINYDISPRDLVVHLLNRAPGDCSEHEIWQLAHAACETLGLCLDPLVFRDLLRRSKAQETT